MLINSQMKYLKAENINDALENKKKFSGSKFLAGGTDLIPLMKYGVKNPEYVIDISNIDGMDCVFYDDDIVSIGAGIKLSDLADNTYIKEKFSFLSYAAKCVASPQIRNIAPLGGNILQDRRCMYYNQTSDWRSSIEACFKTGGEICHQVKSSNVCRAIYYSDIAPVLLALDTRVSLIENGKEKNIPLKELILQHSIDNGTVRDSDFLIKSFTFKNHINTYNKFYKYSVRQSIDFPTMNIAVFFDDVQGKPGEESFKIFIGALNSHPIELEKAERAVVNYLCKSNCNIDINEICQNAIAEIKEKSAIVRETGISMKAKKMTFNNIDIAIKDFIKFWNLNSEKTNI